MIENKSNTNNSIAFDVTKDDLAYNGYMALAHAICGVKDCNGVWKPISLGQVRKIFGLNERDADDVENEKEIEKSKKYEKTTTSKFKYINIKVLNIETFEVETFNNTEELAKHFGVNSNFNSHIRNNWTYKNKYRFKADINPEYIAGASESKKLKVIDTNTNKTTIYDSVKIASKKLNLSMVTIYTYAKYGSLTKTGLKFEYLVEN